MKNMDESKDLESKDFRDESKDFRDRVLGRKREIEVSSALLAQLEEYLRLKALPVQFLREHPNLAQFLHALRQCDESDLDKIEFLKHYS